MPGFVHLAYKRQPWDCGEILIFLFLVSQFICIIPIYLHIIGAGGLGKDNWGAEPVEETVAPFLFFCAVEVLFALKWAANEARKSCSCKLISAIVIVITWVGSSGAMWLKMFGITPFHNDYTWIDVSLPFMVTTFLLVWFYIPSLCRKRIERKRLEALYIKNMEIKRAAHDKAAGVKAGADLDALAKLGDTDSKKDMRKGKKKKEEEEDKIMFKAPKKGWFEKFSCRATANANRAAVAAEKREARRQRGGPGRRNSSVCQLEVGEAEAEGGEDGETTVEWWAVEPAAEVERLQHLDTGALVEQIGMDFQAPRIGVGDGEFGRDAEKIVRVRMIMKHTAQLRKARAKAGIEAWEAASESQKPVLPRLDQPPRPGAQPSGGVTEL